MPSLPIHGKHSRLARLKEDLCLNIGALVERGELRGVNGEVVDLREFAPSVAASLVNALASVYRRHGVEGVKCLLLHYALDYVEHAVRAKTDPHRIVESIEEVLDSVKASLPHELRMHVESSASFTLDYIRKSLNLIIKDVARGLACVEEVAAQLEELVTLMCWHTLLDRRVMGRGISVNFNLLRALSTRVAENMKRRLHATCRDLDLDAVTQELIEFKAKVRLIPHMGGVFLRVAEEEAGKLRWVARVFEELKSAIKEYVSMMLGGR